MYKSKEVVSNLKNENIHPTAIIAPGAELGKNVKIGAYSIIGPHVKLGDDNVIHPHVIINGHTTIGRGNEFFSFCSIGAIPQDYSYNGEDTKLVIGDANTFRECVTINLGTLKQDAITKVGNNSLFMAYVHLGHDTVVGDNCTIANSVNVAGHVFIGDRAIIGGSSAISQFVTIGRGAFIGGASAVDHDIPIYCTAVGNRVRLKGVNIVGMRRQDIPKNQISELVDFLRDMEASGLSPRAFVEHEEHMKNHQNNSLIDEMVRDIKKTQIGIAPFMA
ncbi:MAG: acyl-[acyl-carrier-protein]--UDP-N-acetylglucosamine O-acyltransferase [Bdellovibrionales bacterium RIFOXYD12_FULL_39_22]|nr:MAG: acyl-[acyl-carrier-protein]--UDP-N-acetylglucosamine O-acyltransferase [Bdellovibrionales bacterium RIFOXYB1_FULL_39_21]OFZ41587.1 MAG: acyl-[acyl-carrier-protein]--UDP-N-acetylglucosamine O-acyltransferase [Bdellovibrionales bacterium RIFOXYC12_FULL_39_17]OFZ45900.1 MAG: acyl-[acyl-carrier-protein]--UDP-N-acetylglucosamine O-acyltransferase [Bdellovibrionales bacterium RIFOXYC1_FULL_39_130]OFZ74831.1 MAG: acyl-[acyl-carrier-protein]--UDP-N-acetylglucosamine O-acyltransferase [Bdellovibr